MRTQKHRAPFRPCVRAALLASLVLVIGTLPVLILSHPAAAHLTAESPPPTVQTATPILIVPYYGAKRVTSYFDHEYPNWQINSRIALYDGRVARYENGACGWNSAGLAIAYRTEPNGAGDCIWYDGHAGYDYALAYEPVLAAADGTVTTARWSNWNNRYSGYGLHLRVAHAGGYETIYGHFSALAVITNTQVMQGQIIGTGGNTGNSTGAHLHFEVRLDGYPVDPYGGPESPVLWSDGEWNALGQWVGQASPQFIATYVVDDDNPEQVNDPNDDPLFSIGKGGLGGETCPPSDCPSWWRVTDTRFNGGDMRYTYVHGNVPDYWAVWHPPAPGMYDVQVWIPYKNATTWAARYTLLPSDGRTPSKVMIVDQWGVSDRWISLGVYAFGPSPAAPWSGIWLSDATGEGPNTHGTQANLCYYSYGGDWLCRVGVDAVRFRTTPLMTTFLPMVVKEP